MTGQRTWVCTLDGDAVAVDQIVRYKAVTGTATGRAVIEAFASDGRSPVRLGPFVSAPQALDFARRHFGPVVDPAGLSVADKQRDASRSAEVSPTADAAKHDPPSAAELLEHLDDLKRLNDDLDVAIARQRAAQREAGLRLDGPETA